MAKYTRHDPRNKKDGRNKSKANGNDFVKKIRLTDDQREIHRYKGNKLEWIVTDEEEDEEVY